MITRAFSIIVKSFVGVLLVALLISVQTVVFSEGETFEPSYEGVFDATENREHGQETILLNFRDVDIRTLIGEVSRITGKNFIIDPYVNARITVNSSKPLNAEELYDAFLSILQVNGYVAIPSGNMIKIVPNNQARYLAFPEHADEGGQDAIIFRVISLKNINAYSLPPAIDPLLSDYGNLSISQGSNSIILADRAGVVNRITTIIERLDNRPAGDIDIINLKFATAAELANTLRNLMGYNDFSYNPDELSLNISVDNRTNSLILRGPPAKRIQARVLIEQLDTEKENFGNTQVVHLNYLKAEDIEPTLQEVVASYGGSSVDQGDFSTPGGGSPFNFKPSVKAEKGSNAIVITASPDLMHAIKTVIGQLDSKRAQVLVNAIIVEMTGNINDELGINWATGGRVVANTSLGAANSLNSGFNQLGFLQKGSNTFNFVLNALSTNTSNNVLSTPTLVTLDNEEAEIKVQRIFTRQSGRQDTEGGSGRVLETFGTDEAGLTLKITPRINRNGEITLEIKNEFSNTTTNNLNTGSTNPDKNLRSMEAKVLVRDQEMLVLGGLLEDRLEETFNKVPLLGDIPGLGRLFQYRKTTKTKTNLMVFLQPTIILGDSTGVELTNDKYHLIRQQQLQSQRHLDNPELILPTLGAPLPIPNPFTTA